MIIVASILTVVLLGILTIASYVERIYAEMGKFLRGEYQQNIDFWEATVEPRLGMRRTWAALAAAAWVRLSLAGLALIFGYLLFAGAGHSNAAEIGQVVLGIVLVIILFNQLIPTAFYTRTRGEWIAIFRIPLRILFYVIFPVVIFLAFVLSIAELAESGNEQEDEHQNGAAVDALLEAGKEEGILEESDRDLIRSAVEFGDKVVREVMTPRPAIFAVPGDMTVAAFLQAIEQRPHSRVPVYDGSLDHVTGIAFAHDLLQISDEDAPRTEIASIARPANFVPETKRVSELLREMQRQRQHMRVVIDEYGGVAGLVTIEDLIEEIVGDIGDEHEGSANLPVREPGGSWLVPGIFEVARLRDLVGEDHLFDHSYQATTVSGLVSEIAGSIPRPGEVTVAGPLRFEVVAATNRRIERLRVSVIENAKD